MGQRVADQFGRIFLIFLLLASGSCERSTTTGARAAKHPTVASLVPAATGLLVGIHAADHLVAVSNWDPDRAETAGLPRVGDYRSVDWEKLAQVRPDCMIVQFAPDKMPAGLEDRAKSMGIKLVNVKMNTMDDIRLSIVQLGEVVNQSVEAKQAIAKLNDDLEASAAIGRKHAPVTALITRAEPSNALACVGGGNYLDEILTLAGGKNVLGGGDNSYPNIDREKLIELNPQVVFVFLPGASQQVINQTKKFWDGLPQLAAVKKHRIYIMTDGDLLLPGFGVTKIARLFAEHLHNNP